MRRLDDSVAAALGAMIGSNDRLTELDLSNNRLRWHTGKVHARTISRRLPPPVVSRQMHSAIALMHCVQAVAAGLKTSAALTTLRIGFNALGVCLPRLQWLCLWLLYNRPVSASTSRLRTVSCHLHGDFDICAHVPGYREHRQR